MKKNEKNILFALLLFSLSFFGCQQEDASITAKGQPNLVPTVRVFVPTVIVVSSSTPVVIEGLLDEQTKQALVEAINDEYKAKALYNAVITKIGESNPFLNI